VEVVGRERPRQGRLVGRWPTASIWPPWVLNLVADWHPSGHRDRYDRSMGPSLADLILVITAWC
jgi:hypothetical protein